jgi:hypothetical protein
MTLWTALEMLEQNTSLHWKENYKPPAGQLRNYSSASMKTSKKLYPAARQTLSTSQEPASNVEMEARYLCGSYQACDVSSYSEGAIERQKSDEVKARPMIEALHRR